MLIFFLMSHALTLLVSCASCTQDPSRTWINLDVGVRPQFSLCGADRGFGGQTVSQGVPFFLLSYV